MGYSEAMNALLLLIVYCGLIVVVSLAGGRLSSLLRMTHLRTQLLMSGVGGLMLGIALLHLLPHATETLRSPGQAGVGALAGLTAMFLLVRLFHTHDHSVPVVENGDALAAEHDETECSGDSRNHSPSCVHGHSHGDPIKGISWFGLFFGLLLHTLVDGIALSASVMAEVEHGAWLGLGGLGTFLAVALHKPLDAFAITSVMNRQNWSTAAQWTANIVFSTACPLGALAFYFGASGVIDNTGLLGWGLAISAGFFIGIALADLLPEVAFHDHDRGKLTATFLLGIAVAVAVENLPGHSHDHGSIGGGHGHPEHVEHEHVDHDHHHDHGEHDHHGDHSGH
ncbi:ZIP family metal transporter [Rhodopirellula sp. JC639]|uniref:ZIP family metal transporter n=1 Tax=Stieleria mannarensis TaxID=2755585 RepID=UPI0016037DC3|nr:ZIP family metal transporter [Rhodopirellula sp. JC639]